MNKREEFEAAFAAAAADLARAESDLAQAVAEHAKAAPDPVEGDAHLEHARAACRQARAKLVQLIREAPPPASKERPEKPKPIRQAEKHPGKPSRQRITLDKLLRAFPGLHAFERAVPNWRLIVRQSLMLLALVLAYLQYYFFDVQLEVSRLRSVTLFLLH